MKKTPSTLLAILDTLASGTVVYSDAAVACGVRPNTFWHWVRASQLNRDPDLIVPFLGERMWFHHAVEAARQIALHDTRARTEKRSQKYLGEPVFFRDIPEHGAVGVESEPVADVASLLGPEPVAAVEPVPDRITAPVAEIIPDKISEPNPPDAEPVPDKIAVDETPRRAPRSPLEADLFARLAAARAKNAPPADEGPGNRKALQRPPQLLCERKLSFNC